MHSSFVRALSSQPRLQWGRSSAHLGIPGHDLLSEGTRPGSWDPLTLESLRDLLRAQAQSERADDRVTLLGDCGFSFDEDGCAFVKFRSAGRSPGPRRFGRARPMTQHAFSQLLRTISRGRSGDLLEDLVRRGGQSNLRLATRIMSSLVGERHAERRLRFRTVYRDPGLWLEDFPAAVPGRARQIVTAVLGHQYRSYDDVDFVSDLVEQVPTGMKLEVINAWRSSDGLRVRTRLGDEEPEVAVPFPMVEFRNSEVGSGAAMLRGGLFTLHCTNGMHSWDDWAVERWPHRGDMSRVSDEIATAIQKVHVGALTTLSRYERGRLQVVASSPEGLRAWLEDRQRHYRLTGKLIDRTLLAIEDPTTSRTESGDFTLASVVDAVTLQAQDASFGARLDLERLAGRILEGEVQRAA